MSTPASTSTPESRASGTRPTVVLVHGAFADSSLWNAVVARLEEDGFPVVAVANPLRGLRRDAASTRDVLAALDGPVVLVGHAYGGSVISTAADGADDVRALVYIAGLIPDEEESAADLAALFPDSTLAESLREVPLVHSGDPGDVDLYIDPSRFHRQFAADLTPEQAAVLAATQRPVSATALTEAATVAAWQRIPVWALTTTDDRVIPHEAQVYMAERALAHVRNLEASHAVPVSAPEAVVRVIQEAATATG
ncbi:MULTISPECIES: alpha/beta hydrolase [Streptomyces]|uniref:alpha/beta fold hydrolase n=1 Tax=Streptomyces TaxID=1883 RepID=UPI00240D99A2|nr:MULTISPECIES: alpha/beta hydrolase [Streptomyces]WFB88552.1 alpha/beta hydrolase [Streptomyces olivaceus]WGK50693.1 alpha/beta hydrolase [Streptomyces sp. B146]